MVVRILSVIISNKLFLFISRASRCTMEPRTERYLTFSEIYDFVCSVQLVARRNHALYAIHSFWAFTISCNKLHATIYDFPRNVHLDARPNHAQYETKCGDFSVYFSDNVLSISKSVIHFVRSVQLVARMNQPRYVIHDFPVTCILMHERFNLGA